MLKIYISGPISGHDPEKVAKRFEKAKNHLLEAGLLPVSPLENGLPETAPYDEHMQKDLEMLAECEAIYMMKGWNKSNGCRIEMAHAIANEKNILFEKK